LRCGLRQGYADNAFACARGLHCRYFQVFFSYAHADAKLDTGLFDAFSETLALSVSAKLPDAEMAGSARPAYAKGERLAQLVAQKRALLILDGLEPNMRPAPRRRASSGTRGSHAKPRAAICRRSAHEERLRLARARPHSSSSRRTRGAQCHRGVKLKQ
jgi:hypothetical protein